MVCSSNDHEQEILHNSESFKETISDPSSLNLFLVPWPSRFTEKKDQEWLTPSATKDLKENEQFEHQKQQGKILIWMM